MSMLTNPVIISVLAMTTLSLLKLPVLLALFISALIAGFAAGMPVDIIMGHLIGGMGGNANTALSYVLLGTLAACITKTGAADVLAKKIGGMIRGSKIALAAMILLVSMASGTIVPVHIAFIPILIPPLLNLMNEMKMDRRMATVSFGFGLKATYITVPIAYGTIFHGIIKDSMGLAGMEVTMTQIWQSTWMAGVAMIIGLIIGWTVFSKDREYVKDPNFVVEDHGHVRVEARHWLSLIAGFIALGVQLYTESLPLGALASIVFMVVTKTIKWSEIQEVLNEGVNLMGYIAFVMLVAAGYAVVIKETGGVPALVDSAIGILGAGNKLGGAFVMVFLGLLITMGIGTSFGTVPVVAAIYVPLAAELGFSPSATIFMIAIAAALGDAGSPASDTTLGPTAGLNADGQHDHIWDTCVPQFLCYNIPLMIAGTIWPLFL